jgi:glycosyltransferase involved in cell wall biosynthesis
MDGFANVGSGYEFTIFVQPQNRSIFEKYRKLANFRVVEVGETDHRLIRALYSHAPLPLRARVAPDILNERLSKRHGEVLDREADVHYAPYCPPIVFPYPSKPSLYSIHDLQHIHYPDFFTPEQLWERRVIFAQCIDHATVIQASSAHMRRDFLENFASLTSERIAVIPEGVDILTFSRPSSQVNVKAAYRLPDSFVFFPAQLWHHKNHITILRALKRLRDAGVVLPLVLTGAKYEASQGIFEYIEDKGLTDQVFYLGVVPFEHLVALYQSARFLITAVLYESSSMPILEAAAAGTAIVASRTPPNEELAEHLRMTLFAPTDADELAERMTSVWNDRESIQEQVEENRAKIKRYSWESAARQYIEVFRLMVGDRATARADRQAS